MIPRDPKAKLITEEHVPSDIDHRRRTAKTVFTNGCFDLVHRGHVDYLWRCRLLGDKLIVGINTDASVRRLKGPSRPVTKEQDRAFVLAALECVDYVFLFSQDDPLQLIRAVQPDVLIKGGDWPPEKIVGRDVVRARGGEVYSLPFVPGHSTTELIRGIVSLAGQGHSPERNNP